MIARVFLLGILAAGAEGVAHAQAYVRAGATVSQADPYEPAIGYEIAGGYDLGAWRGEISVDTNEFDVRHDGTGRFQGNDGTITTGFASLYYDFEAGFGLTPYLGGGLGVAKIEAPPVVGSIPGTPFDIAILLSGFDATEAVWQGAAGVNLAVGSNLSLDASYRYVDYPDEVYLDNPATDGEELTADGAHQLRLSLRYGF
jgi:opacity protein-like surface antigen